MVSRNQFGLDPLDALASALNLPVHLCQPGQIGDLDLNSMHKYLLNPCWGKVDTVDDAADATDASGAGDLLINMLTGKTIIIAISSFRLTVADLKDMIQDREDIQPEQQKLIASGWELDDNKRLCDYNIGSGSTVHLVLRFRGGHTWKLDSSVLSPGFDYDFTRKKDDVAYERGGMPYTRPCGWQRYALNVETRYGSKVWLEGSRRRMSQYQSAPDEWPVSYHGTSQHNGLSIAQEGFQLSKGLRFTYGRGIYSTPNPRVALQYAKIYEHNGHTYRMILQNRVNPEFLVKANGGNYWIVPKDEDIRPYGFCLMKVNARDPDAHHFSPHIN